MIKIYVKRILKNVLLYNHGMRSMELRCTDM